MDYFPIFVNLNGQDCLVVGAGDIAARKIDLLARAGAKITVIAKEIGETVLAMQITHSLHIQQTVFTTRDLRQYKLIVSATDDVTTNQLVAKTATEQGIPVNVVDNPGLSSFIFPAIVDRSPIVVAVSSGGAPPFWRGYLEQKLNLSFRPLMGDWRPWQKNLGIR